MAKSLAFALCLAGLSSFSSLAKADLFYGSNAVVNGDAESNNDFTLLNGWVNSGSTYSDGVIAVSYGHGAGYPDPTTPILPATSRGSNFIAGGNDAALSSATQLLNISNVSTAIDSHLVSYNLSGYLGGYATQADWATFSVTFENGSGGTIGVPIVIGPVTNSERGNISELLLRQATGSIPVGTRQLLFTFTATRFEGANDDGYGENLSFVADGPGAVPEPSTWAMMILGFAGVGFMAYRRRSNAMLAA